VICVSEARINGYKRLIEEAAKLLLTERVWRKTGAAWSNDPNLKSELAARLCIILSEQRLQGYRDSVTSKWVSRNRRLIEQGRHKLSQELAASCDQLTRTSQRGK
jgi:hypothetical protein